MSKKFRDQGKRILFSSVGINGECVDTYEGIPKPSIKLSPGDFFVTASAHLSGNSGKFRMIQCFGPPEFSRNYCLCQALISQSWILEGPNDLASLVNLKEGLKEWETNLIVLLDGSIDRQFLGHPKICDYFYFSLLITDRKEQIEKASQLLEPIHFKACSNEQREWIQKIVRTQTRSLLFDESGMLVYEGFQPPFLDSELKSKIRPLASNSCTLYLNGALTHSLCNFLSPYQNWRIILDNFTLYQRISVTKEKRSFRPEICLFHPLRLKGIFLREVSFQSLDLPEKIPIHNIYREDSDAISIS
ncbi:hypothetical protein HOF92_02265 [bacterium]|nr:hypothetical protein [bacterium]